ncbi:GGDEF domain-containing protein [Azospirillum sp. TSO22-1]|uniref:GGDEF domain-containing protein n=1 Tax=Azospirillum sp. TSO22-1 TaxID=716789 RepID=UPI000D64D567|nr:GGDEF domain-containing protein [Azospirillum sp. TSO22-1]
MSDALAPSPGRRQRVALFTGMLVVACLLAGGFAVFDLTVTGYTHHATAEAAALVGFGAALLLLRSRLPTARAMLLAIGIAGVLFLYKIFTGRMEDAVLVWAPAFAAMPIFLFGVRSGLCWIIIYDAILVAGLGVAAASGAVTGLTGAAAVNAVGATVAVALVVYYCEFSRVEARRHLREAALTDYLTGIHNRRSFEAEAERELARAARGGQLSLALIDVDHFKRINDRWGHDVGDAAIRHVAGLLAGNTRRLDIAGRLGGEEFGVLLVDAEPAAAAETAERLRRCVEETPFPGPDGPLALTVSVGVAAAKAGTPFHQLYAQADRRLYCAKEGGRNRVVAE